MFLWYFLIVWSQHIIILKVSFNYKIVRISFRARQIIDFLTSYVIYFVFLNFLKIIIWFLRT